MPRTTTTTTASLTGVLVGALFACLFAGGACASLEGNPAGLGSGGVSGTGGAPIVATGGSSATGVGDGNAGGSAGGASGTGGAVAGKTGGTTGSGGKSASGGAGAGTGTSTGGVSATGGSAPGRSGGATGTIPVGGSQGTVTKVDLKGKKVLFIVDDPASLSDGDTMLKSIMEVSKDMIVTMGNTVTPNPDAASMNLIVASSGASASEFPALYKGATVPMIIFSNGAYQAMGFITASAGKGSASTPVMATIVDDTTPLASGMAVGTNFSAIGTSRSTSVYWGNPGGNPIKVAAIVGAPTQLISFAYEKGATMATGSAPARRVALGFKTDVIGDLSIESTKLLNAAIEWTAGALP